MEPQASATFIFDDPERKGTIRVKPGGYGLEVEVTDGKTNWLFLVDLYYLTKNHTAAERSVQIVAYHPQDHNGDPVQHLRVYPDGKIKTFKV